MRQPYEQGAVIRTCVGCESGATNASQVFCFGASVAATRLCRARPSVFPSLTSKNPSWSNPVSVPTWSERARWTIVRPNGIRRVIDFGFDQASRYRDALVIANTRSLRPLCFLGFVLS